MDKRILKTILVAVSITASTLIVPVFGQWYRQQTGIDTTVFYIIAFISGFAISIFSLLKIWGEIK